jgi:hypothetical protein
MFCEETRLYFINLCCLHLKNLLKLSFSHKILLLTSFLHCFMWHVPGQVCHQFEHLRFHYSETGEKGKRAIHSEVNVWSLGILCNFVHLTGINTATVQQVNWMTYYILSLELGQTLNELGDGIHCPVLSQWVSQIIFPCIFYTFAEKYFKWKLPVFMRYIFYTTHKLYIYIFFKIDIISFELHLKYSLCSPGANQSLQCNF